MNDELSNRLHQEGLASSREFSPELHERTMRVLRQSRLRDSVYIVPVERWRLAVAAAAAIVISATGWWAYNSKPAIVSIVRTAPPAPIAIAIRTPAPDELLRTADPIARAISGVGAAPLEDIAQDAKSMASYFVRQLPTFSAPPKNNRQL